MKATMFRKQRIDVDVKYVRISVPVADYRLADPDDWGIHPDTPGLVVGGDPQRPDDGLITMVVEVDTGKVVSPTWPEGYVFENYYKACDTGVFELLDADKNVIATCGDHYVPTRLIPCDGDSDYIDFKIDDTGQWTNWKPMLSPFHDFPGFSE